MVRASSSANADFGGQFNRVQQDRLASFGRQQELPDAIDTDIPPEQDRTSINFQQPRKTSLPAVGINFDKLPKNIARLDSTVSFSVHRLINAGSHEQVVAEEAHLRRTLARDTSLDTDDLIKAKRYLSVRIADLHTDDPSTAPNPRAFEAYMTALRTLDTILDRRRNN